MSDFDIALDVIQKLTPLEKIRLMEKLAHSLGDEIAQPTKPRPSLYGLLADLGQAPSAEDIDEARQSFRGEQN